MVHSYCSHDHGVVPGFFWLNYCVLYTPAWYVNDHVTISMWSDDHAAGEISSHMSSTWPHLVVEMRFWLHVMTWSMLTVHTFLIATTSAPLKSHLHLWPYWDLMHVLGKSQLFLWGVELLSRQVSANWKILTPISSWGCRSNAEMFSDGQLWHW